ncbi:hypothetical protein NLX71_20990 [Paenibacillus sp. MZ04-78.2]|uniref:hypothetical protein n=1 Tax=Paenibacillus sp. MZ04-78.2 TaxID=2962034 RepID=UPI0020B81EC5|nr:hypothetical protein [Paenibacillus sp. MZ04-78.2]MCP3775755.1 hypothetical protein [Paenibacillus sp. MZ04-78.2]
MDALELASKKLYSALEDNVQEIVSAFHHSAVLLLFMSIVVLAARLGPEATHRTIGNDVSVYRCAFPLYDTIGQPQEGTRFRDFL